MKFPSFKYKAQDQLQKKIFLGKLLRFFDTVQWNLSWWFSGKESPCQCRIRGFYPLVWRAPGEGTGNSTPVFLPGKSHGQRSLVGYSPGGLKRDRHDLATKQTNKKQNNNKKCVYMCMKDNFIWEAYCGQLQSIFNFLLI